MGSPARRSRSDFLEAALEILTEKGLAGLTTTSVCDRLDVTRGSLYHHFESGPALRQAVIEHWERVVVPERLAAVEAISPEERIDLLQRLASYADTREERAIRGWAQLDAGVAATVGRIDRLRMEVLTRALADVGVEPPLAATLARIGFSLLLAAELEDGMDRGHLVEVLEEYRAWIEHRRIER